MPNTQPEEINEHLAAREFVLLLFNKQDSQIARNWAKPETKHKLDGKN
jgi:hypothetical protein